MQEPSILWADDEIDLLRPHIMFLESKGYRVTTVNNGPEAVEKCENQHFDIVFLDENMPGLTGLEVLPRIKQLHPSLPIIMITKSEEESIMEEAIGSKISDYLIKPVNPNQILLSVKKHLDQKRLVSEKTNTDYGREFREISMELMNDMDRDDWTNIYRKLTFWSRELETSGDESMAQILDMQHRDANVRFSKYIAENYIDWLQDPREAPVMSHNVFQRKVAPMLKGPSNESLFLVVVDNLRFDQWKVMQQALSEWFRVENEDLYLSILPTATQYCRNALFSGLLPSQMEDIYPDLWRNEDDDGGKNMFEEQFLGRQLKHLDFDIKYSYNKITNLNAGRRLADSFSSLLNNKLNVIVYNFVDMLSHARTEMEVIKELADDEAAYRSLTESWFKHSPLLDIFKKIAESKSKVILTTDHGTVRVQNPVKIVGDRNTNTNLRYKTGKNLNYNSKEVFEIKNPKDAFLPRINVSSSYVFAREDDFFVYPNNYNHFVNFYRNTFQHGGISMEEMLIPLIVLQSK
jgi:CheY-like chemotaxis protein